MLPFSAQLSDRAHCTVEGIHSWLAVMTESSRGWAATGGRKVGVVLEEVGGAGRGQSPGGNTEGMG